MATPAGGSGGPEKASWLKFSLFSPMIKPSAMSMPSKESVAAKLNAFGRGGASKRRSLVKNLKKAGGHAVLFGGTMAGSKLGGDSAVRKGAKWAGKNRETEEGVASYRRGQIGRGIKKRWGKAVESLGKFLNTRAQSKLNSSGVKLGTRKHDFLSALRNKTVDMEVSGYVTKITEDAGRSLAKKARQIKANKLQLKKDNPELLRKIERLQEKAVKNSINFESRLETYKTIDLIAQVGVKYPQLASIVARELDGLLLAYETSNDESFRSSLDIINDKLNPRLEGHIDLPPIPQRSNQSGVANRDKITQKLDSLSFENDDDRITCEKKLETLDDLIEILRFGNEEKSSRLSDKLDSILDDISTGHQLLEAFEKGGKLDKLEDEMLEADTG